MNYPLEDKNIAMWNEQPLDSWRDIIISFEFNRYALNFTPTGGFAIIFFDSIVNQPRRGGRDYSLGYTPNDVVDYCKQSGYEGLEAAFLGIGFDNYGYFALRQPYVTGIPASALNVEPTLGIRGGVKEEYGLLYASTLSKLTSSIDGASRFTVGQNVSSLRSVEYRAVRIVMTNAGTQLKIQVKDNIDNENFQTIATYALPFKDRTALKVGLTHTCAESFTKFNVRNFNVAGSPGLPTTRRLDQCTQIIEKDDRGTGGILSMGDEYIATPEPRKISTYTSDTITYNFKNSLYSGTGITMMGDDGKNIIAKIDGSSTVLVYTYLGEKLFKTAKFITPDNREATSADIAKDTLVICTDALSGTAYIYSYIDDINLPSQYGSWLPYQTIRQSDIPKAQGIVGNSVQIQSNNLIIGDRAEMVHAFRKDITNTWSYIQSLSTPVTAAAIPGQTGYGRSIALENSTLLVAAPISRKASFINPGQGEVYHYTFLEDSNQWRLVMAIGNFYRIDTPAGNFGYSLQLRNNVCVIGSPGEAYVESPGATSQITNMGRAYVFRKTPQGLFTQAAILTPPANIRQKDMLFGSQVGVNNNLIGVLSPFTELYKKSFLSIYKLECEFPSEPIFIPIPDCALILMDYSGFIVDLFDNSYILSYSCVLGYPLGDGP